MLEKEWLEWNGLGAERSESREGDRSQCMWHLDLLEAGQNSCDLHFILRFCLVPCGGQTAGGQGGKKVSQGRSGRSQPSRRETRGS